jgi:nicotinamide riboside kinase
VTTWTGHAKVAFIGSHGIRKTTAAHAFANVIQRAGRSVEYGREVVRDNPLGLNEGATGEAQLWVIVSQIRQELELAPKADVLVLDRGVMDNFAYYLRACGGEDRFAVGPLVAAWSATYDLVVRLLPDIALRADGVRSTSDVFRDEIEAILDARLSGLVTSARLATLPASDVTDDHDWWPLAERLAAIVGQPLLAEGVAARHRSDRRVPRRLRPSRQAGDEDGPQLPLELSDD